MLDFIIARLSLQKYQDKRWNELSGGFKLRFELARQLIWRPKLLILDEPLANLDIKTQLLFLNDLRSLVNSISHSMAVIISSQNIYEIEKISDHIIFMRNGIAIYNGKVEDLGVDRDFRCYEIDTDKNVFELQQALRSLAANEIRTVSFYKLVFTDKYTYSEAILKQFADQSIDVKYFRDITNSTRMLFEK